MSSFTDRDDDTFRVELSDSGRVIDFVFNEDLALSFYAEDAPEIIKLIQEATK